MAQVGRGGGGLGYCSGPGQSGQHYCSDPGQKEGGENIAVVQARREVNTISVAQVGRSTLLQWPRPERGGGGREYYSGPGHMGEHYCSGPGRKGGENITVARVRDLNTIAVAQARRSTLLQWPRSEGGGGEYCSGPGQKIDTIAVAQVIGVNYIAVAQVIGVNTIAVAQIIGVNYIAVARS